MSPLDNDALKAALALPQEERRRMVTKISFQQGTSAAAQVSAVWLPVVAYLNFGSGRPARWFQTRLNVSAKTSVVIMPIIFGFGVVSEQVATRLANPKAFALDITTGRVSALPPHKKLANYVYDSPIRSLIMLGIPGVLAIFLSKGGQTELSISQRIMHTRVAGQFSILTILVGTMGLHDYMSKRGGRYLEPWEEELKLKQQKAAEDEERNLHQ